MPHIIVKLLPGKTEEQKSLLAERITHEVMDVLHYGPDSVSVAMEEVPLDRWKPDVYEPDIVARPDTLLKKPGYRM